MNGQCRFCKEDKTKGVDFFQWVKPTFTDHDKLQPGNVICFDCLFWFNERSEKLSEAVGKEKPQKMRNYSHFIVAGEWIPCSKGNKDKMVELLLSHSFPELAAIADSGQKHIVFRAKRNLPNSHAGWVQFEEQSLWLNPNELRTTLDMIKPALSVFSKAEITAGDYKPYRILNFGINEWQNLEKTIKPMRGTLFFQLVMFLAQKQEVAKDGKTSDKSIRGNMEGDRQRLQESLPKVDLGTIREHNKGGGIHQQVGKVHQLGLFEIECPNTSKHDRND